MFFFTFDVFTHKKWIPRMYYKIIACLPFEIIFIPIASPVCATNRRNKFLPAICVETRCSLANRLVESKAAFKITKLEYSFTQCTALAAVSTEGKRIMGPRVIPSPTIQLLMPIFSTARQPEKNVNYWKYSTLFT